MTSVLTAPAGGASIERRRAYEMRSLGISLNRLLISQPTLDETCRLLVSLLAAPLSPRGAGMVASSHDSLHWLGAHFPSTSNCGHRTALTGDDAVPSVVQGALRGTAGLDAHTLRDEHLTIAAWPLGASVSPLGCLIILLPLSVDERRTRSCLDEVSDVLALYTAGVLRGQLEAGDPGSDARPADATPEALTPRQREVLRWLSAGLTMRQIAHRIGFSDSTVRAESLAIYRRLGVHDRQQAVVTAQALELLDCP